MRDPADDYATAAGMVSVVIPVYNCEQYLPQSIDSVLSQTYRNIEIILVDDGSTDGSGKMCDEYALRDDRIVTIHTYNNGPAAARNIGIDRSNGGLLFFVDADDSIKENALHLLVELYKRHGSDMVIGGFMRFKNGGARPEKVYCLTEDRLLTRHEIVDQARSYLKKPNRSLLFAYSWGRLFKASVIRDNGISFDEHLRTFEDVAFNFDYLKFANTVSFLREALYNHRLHDTYTSATMAISDNPAKLFGYRVALRKIAAFLEESDPSIDVEREVGHAWTCLTIIQLVRTCGQINLENRDAIHTTTRKIVDDPATRSALRHYRPSGEDSRTLPVLIRFRLVPLIVMLCRYKARMRYGKAPSS